jgi:hypothetical protein
MPTKKGKSKPAKAKKASNKLRRGSKRVATGRVTAKGTSVPKMTGGGSRAGKSNPAPPAPEGSPDQKATGQGATEGAERVRIL